MSMRTPERQRCFDKVGGRCFYCGLDLLDDDAAAMELGKLFAGGRGIAGAAAGAAYRNIKLREVQLDHQIPRARGGSNGPGNLVAACGACNAAKHDLTVEEYRVHLMMTRGRPPRAFFGEPARPARDWIMACHAPKAAAERKAAPRTHERLAPYLGAGP